MQTNKETFDETFLYPSKKKQTKKEKKRSFRAIFENPDGKIILDGKYNGTKPRQAASKAFTKILQIYSKAGKELTAKIYFGLKECTPKKKNMTKKINKCYWYTGIKKKLEKPAKSRTKKDLTTGTPYINPITKKPVIDPKTGKEVIDPKTCSPLLDISGNPIIIYHKFTNDVKKSKSIFCKHLLNYDQEDDEENEEDCSVSSNDSKYSNKQEKKPTKKNNKK